jgi:hypothetical protein
MRRNPAGTGLLEHRFKLRSVAAKVAIAVVACAAAGSTRPAAAAETGATDGSCHMSSELFGDRLGGGACQGPGSIAPQLDPLPALTYAPGAIVAVSGRGIGVGQQVGIDGQWSPIQANPGGGLSFVLPAAVRAGTSAASLGAGDPPTPIQGVRAQQILVRPALASATFDSGEVRIVTAPAVEAGQAVTLNLARASASSVGPASVSASVTPSEASSEIAFALPQTVPPGTYLASVSVDGVSSLPRYDGGTYTGPLVQIR